jgi:hypothetical protein
MITALEKLARKKQQWKAVNDALDALLADGTVKSYSFSDPNGSQNATRRSIDEYKKLITELEADIEKLERKLKGGGLRTFTTNRYR